MDRTIIDKILHRLLCLKWHRELDCHYKKVLKTNNIVNSNKEKENLWLQKWGGIKYLFHPCSIGYLENILVMTSTLSQKK